MPVSTAASLGLIASELLTVATDALADTVGGPVALSFLSPGLPSLDTMCDQVIVWSPALGEEQTSPLSPTPATGMRRRNGWLNLATLSILTARCVNVGDVGAGGYQTPTVTALDSDALKVMEDGWALWNAVNTAFVQDGLFDGTCKELRILSTTALDPRGGLAGWTMVVQVELAGYRT